MRRFIVISLLLCLTATTSTFAQGAKNVPATATTSQQVVKGKKLNKTEKSQQPTQQIRKTEQTQQKVNKKTEMKKMNTAHDQAEAKYYKAVKLAQKMQNKLDAARSTLVELRDELVAEKLSISKKLTQSGKELTAEQAAEMENEMKKMDTKYAHKISKAQMDYDNALIEMERAQDRVHEAKVEYEKSGGH